MFKKLYLKLYFYIFISVISSIFITSLYFYFKMNYYQVNDIRGNGSKTSLLIRDEILKVESLGIQEIDKRLNEINKHLEWYIAFIKDDKIVASSGENKNRISEYNLKNLRLDKDSTILSKTDKYIDIGLFLDNSNPNRGVLFISITRKHSDNFISFEQILLIAILIGLLLIPFSLYLLSPYKKLIKSINSISEGDFNKKLVIDNNEFKELYEAFNNMSIRINEMIKQKQRLIADVSHELRSPLTRMRMSQEILLNSNIKDKNKYIYETIDEIENLDKTISNLLILSKFELDQSELKIEKVDIKRFILEIIDKNYILFDNHKIKFNFNLIDNVICNIDLVLFESAFNNIFSNLIRYSPFNSYVDINMTRYKSGIHIEIRDRGIGVKKSELERIFEPFYRTDESRNSETGGTGLGLAILKKIIHAHHGKVFATLPDDQEGGLVINILLKDI